MNTKRGSGSSEIEALLDSLRREEELERISALYMQGEITLEEYRRLLEQNNARLDLRRAGERLYA